MAQNIPVSRCTRQIPSPSHCYIEVHHDIFVSRFGFDEELPLGQTSSLGTSHNKRNVKKQKSKSLVIVEWSMIKQTNQTCRQDIKSEENKRLVESQNRYQARAPRYPYRKVSKVVWSRFRPSSSICALLFYYYYGMWMKLNKTDEI